MARFIKKLSRKSGLPPGTLVHVGQKKIENVKMGLFSYDEARLDEDLDINLETMASAKKRSVNWLNVYGVHDPHIVQTIGDQFGIHPLALEDIVNTGQRPKFEDFGDYAFVVLKMLSLDKNSLKIRVEQVSFVFGKDFVLSFQERLGDVFEPVRERIRGAKGRIRRVGPDYLLYALIDATVDNYFAVLETMGDRLEVMEEKLLADSNEPMVESIYQLKRELIILRKSVWPLREVISNFQRLDTSYIHESTKTYIRDVHDHTIQIIDTIESFRDVITGLREMHMTNVSNRMNVIMKFLTIVSTMFIPITFVAGLYGMNFKYMPELEWSYGYQTALAAMATITAGMIFYFRKKKWF